MLIGIYERRRSAGQEPKVVGLRPRDGICQDHLICWSDIEELKFQTGALSLELTVPVL